MERHFDQELQELKNDILKMGAFAEEVCLLASIEKTQKPFELEKKEILSLHRVLVGLLHTPISARIVFDGSPLDVVPFALTSYSSLRFEGYDSFNLAFDHYFTHLTVENKSPSFLYFIFDSFFR